MPAKSSSYKRDHLRTLVVTDPLYPPATYTDPIMLVGSCFTEHIGNRLKSLKFNVCLNPFGIVYNPLSIAGQLECLLGDQPIAREDLVFHEDLWHSWIHHSRFSHPDPEYLLESILEQTRAASEFLKRASLLILTFGTPEAYFLKADNRLVSNCHKMPADHFYSRKAGPTELAGQWIPLIGSLRERNPELRMVLTVSPVRYFKDGPTGNQMSKSILFLFIQKLLETYPELYYFPAYEIFMDDLRDYRFYDTDMMHPGPPGIEYVWTRFVQSCIDPAVYPVMKEVESLVKASDHRHGEHQTDAHRRFLKQQISRISEISLKNPFLDFTKELELLDRQIRSDQPGL